MIAALSLVLICQLAGEAAMRAAALPVPGPVIGLALMLLLLLLRDRFGAFAKGPLQDGSVESVSKNLLSHLSLLFVPAGVGVIQQLDLIAAHGVATLAVLAGSVLITLLVTVGAFLAASRAIAKRGEPK